MPRALTALLSLFAMVSPSAYSGVWDVDFFLKEPDFQVVLENGNPRILSGGHDEKYIVQTPSRQKLKLRFKDALPLYAEVPVNFLAHKVGLPGPLVYPVLAKRGENGIPSVQEAQSYGAGPHWGLAGSHGDWFSATLQPMVEIQATELEKFNSEHQGQLLAHLVFAYVVGNKDLSIGENIVVASYEFTENHGTMGNRNDVMNLDMTQAFKNYEHSRTGPDALYSLLNQLPQTYWESLRNLNTGTPSSDDMAKKDLLRGLQTAKTTVDRLEQVSDEDIDKLFGTYFANMNSKRRAQGLAPVEYKNILRTRLNTLRSDLENALERVGVPNKVLKAHFSIPPKEKHRALSEGYPRTESINEFPLKNGNTEALWNYYFESYWKTRNAAVEFWSQQINPPPGTDIIRSLLSSAHDRGLKVHGKRDHYFSNPVFEVANENGKPKTSPHPSEERYIVATPQTGLKDWMVARLNSPEAVYTDVGAHLLAEQLNLDVNPTFPVLLERGKEGIPMVDAAKSHPEASALAGTVGKSGVFPALLQSAPYANGKRTVSLRGRAREVLAHAALAYVLGDRDFTIEKLEWSGRGSNNIRSDFSDLLQDFQHSDPPQNFFEILKQLPPTAVWEDFSGDRTRLQIGPTAIQDLVNLESITAAQLRQHFGPAFDAINERRVQQGLTAIDFEDNILKRIQEVRPALKNYLMQQIEAKKKSEPSIYRRERVQDLEALFARTATIPRLKLIRTNLDSLKCKSADCGELTEQQLRWAYFLTPNPQDREHLLSDRAAKTGKSAPELSRQLRQGHGIGTQTTALNPSEIRPLEVPNQNLNRLDITPQEFQREVFERIHRMPEVNEIAQEAARRGMRVWFFGGTAAAAAHYAKWDLMRERGDKRFEHSTDITKNAVQHRFDYHYSSIFRSTQDLDMVADGSASEISDFSSWLRERFPYVEGDKNRWEVRPLRQAHEDKYAVLGDSGFQKQHTDSYSTGMIELTKPPAGEPPIRDARDFGKQSAPRFVKDVLNGNVHFYFSDEHRTTPRYISGLNPEIFSVVRFLTKAFQFEAQIQPEQYGLIKKIIDNFDPRTSLRNDEARAWMLKNGKKLFQHAIDMEYAWNTLEQLGLREKLMKLDNPNDVDSLAWWMNKEPLRTKPLGTQGRTAKELGLSVVSHETTDYLAYESITRSHTGKPNVFASRNGVVGESSSAGVDAFYTMTGDRGARGTGITTRYRVHPDAREGADFIFRSPVKQLSPEDREELVVLNRAALQVIPETLQLTFGQYFDVLFDKGFDDSNKALVERLELSLNRDTTGKVFSKADADLVAQKFLHRFNEPGDLPIEALRRWFQLRVSRGHPEIAQHLAAKHPGLFLDFVYHSPHWVDHPELEKFLSRAIAKADPKTLLSHLDPSKIRKRQSRSSSSATFQSERYNALRNRPDVRERVLSFLDIPDLFVETVNQLGADRGWDKFWSQPEVVEKIAEFFHRRELVSRYHSKTFFSFGEHSKEDVDFDREVLRGPFGAVLLDSEALVKHPQADTILTNLTRSFHRQWNGTEYELPPLQDRKINLNLDEVLVLKNVLGGKHWYRQHRDKLIPIIETLLEQRIAAVKSAIERNSKTLHQEEGALHSLLYEVVNAEHWVKDPKFAQWSERVMDDTDLVSSMRGGETWILVPEVLDKKLQSLERRYDASSVHFLAHALGSKRWFEHPRGFEFAQRLFQLQAKFGRTDFRDLDGFFEGFRHSEDGLTGTSHPNDWWWEHSNADVLLETALDSYLKAVQVQRAQNKEHISGVHKKIVSILNSPRFAGQPKGIQLLKRLIESGTNPFTIISDILSKPAWYESPHLHELLLEVVERGVNSAVPDDLAPFTRNNWRASQDTLLVWIQQHISEHPKAGAALSAALKKAGILSGEGIVPSAHLHSHLLDYRAHCIESMRKLAQRRPSN